MSKTQPSGKETHSPQAKVQNQPLKRPAVGETKLNRRSSISKLPFPPLRNLKRSIKVGHTCWRCGASVRLPFWFVPDARQQRREHWPVHATARDQHGQQQDPTQSKKLNYFDCPFPAEIAPLGPYYVKCAEAEVLEHW